MTALAVEKIRGEINISVILGIPESTLIESDLSSVVAYNLNLEMLVQVLQS